MIPKADILALAKEDRLQNTTVQKDYVLGWLLYETGVVQAHWSDQIIEDHPRKLGTRFDW
jgi:hypothetical protein